MDAYEPCIDVLQELDKLLLHYNSLDTKAARTWNRLKYDPDRSRSLRERLVASVAMLNAFYTSLIHDSQVVILEALERLERDYKGGHREESVASIERITSDDAEDDDAAWTQILRDLEDVGVSQHEAIGYREVIVDWLVTAVNEGRLQEQRPTHDGFSAMSHTFSNALSSEGIENPRASSLGVTPNDSPQEQYYSPHLLTHDSISSASLSQPASSDCPMISHQELTPPMISSSTSLQISDADAASLYAGPGVPLTQPSHSEYESELIPVTPVSEVHNQGIHCALPEPTVQIQPLDHISKQPLPASDSTPVSYYEEKIPMTGDLEWTAQHTVAAWMKNDFHAAERLLEEQLEAVERGQTASSGVQPDRRVLRHLIGVCASFTGHLHRAKRFFESVFNGIYLGRENLDEGDIAAARWLGDVCLALREHHNALLAYSVAYEGSFGRFGVSQERTRRAANEIRVLDHWLFAFGRIECSFQLNVDPTDIFASRHAVEKSNLIRAVKARIYGMKDLNSPGPPINQFIRPSFTVGPRPQIDIMVSKEFLLAPLVSVSTWPLPWDPTFSPQGAAQLDRYMNTIQIVRGMPPLNERPLPVNSLGNSRVLQYVTKRGSNWLISSVKKGLREMGVEHTEHGYEASIVCCLHRHRKGFAWSEGVVIKFRKLQFRNVYGIRISDVQWATRTLTPVRIFSGQVRAEIAPDYANDFKNRIRGILETAEKEASGEAPQENHASTSKNQPSPQLSSPVEKRPST